MMDREMDDYPTEFRCNCLDVNRSTCSEVPAWFIEWPEGDCSVVCEWHRGTIEFNGWECKIEPLTDQIRFLGS